jgi:hypothetical protein
MIRGPKAGLINEWDEILKLLKRKFEERKKRVEGRGKYFKKHEYLKNAAIQLLKNMGCREVMEEYEVKDPKMNYMRRIDVVGFKGEGKIAVECGNDHPIGEAAELVEKYGFKEAYILKYNFRLWGVRANE